jgi:hypothetical protein
MALLRGSAGSCADELVSLMSPDTAAPRILSVVVSGPANDGHVAAGGERDGRLERGLELLHHDSARERGIET